MVRYRRNLIDSVDACTNTVVEALRHHAHMPTGKIFQNRDGLGTRNFRSRWVVPVPWNLESFSATMQIRDTKGRETGNFVREQKSRWYSLHHARQIVDKGSSGI